MGEEVKGKGGNGGADEYRPCMELAPKSWKVIENVSRVTGFLLELLTKQNFMLASKSAFMLIWPNLPWTLFCSALLTA